MLERRTPISVGEAVKKVMEYVSPGKNEQVAIEQCDGRWLGEDLVADHPVPSFDRAAFDGYAVRSEDIQGTTSQRPVRLEVIEEIGAGDVPSSQVGVLQAVRIMTGAQMPIGADAVIMLELTDDVVENGQKFVRVKKSLIKGDNVTYKGQDMEMGTRVVQKGTRINPGVKALLATFGHADVTVSKKPVVGLYATGSELLDVKDPLLPGKIRNSNAYMIQSQITRSGAEPLYFGNLADDLEASYEAIRAALDQVDLLITTGGVSVGDFDYLPQIYEKLGADVLFNKITMRPGSVTTVAHWNGKLLFGLSGNPSACYVGYELFVRPVVRAQMKSQKPHLQKVRAILDTDFPKANPYTRFVRSQIIFRDTKLYATPCGLDKSNIVSSLADSNALMILPGGTRGYETGREVDVLLLEDQEGSSWPWDTK